MGWEAYRRKRADLWSLLEEKAKDRAMLPYDAVDVEGAASVTAELLSHRLGGESGVITRFRAAAELARALNREPLEDGRIEWIEAGDRRILRFVFREYPPLTSIQLEGSAPLPDEIESDVEFGRPFSLQTARSIEERIRQQWIDRGEVLAKIDDITFDSETGVLLVRVSGGVVEHIATESVGEFRLEGTERLFDDLEDDREERRFSFDTLADRLDGMIARGALLDWRIVPERQPDGGFALRVFLRGDDLFEAMGGAAWRDTLGPAGFLRVAKANLTGRGDFVDFLLSGARDSERIRARYHTEYFGGFTNLGAEIGVEAFDNGFPLVDADQKINWSVLEQWEGMVGYAFLQRRLPWGIVGQGGFQYEREQLEATALSPSETRERTSLSLRLDLNRHDRLLFPTRGVSLEATLSESLSGDSLSRFELRGDQVFSPSRGGRHAITGRFGVGLSEGADRKPYWFDPGGFRELYGYIPYGAAAPQYARVGATWRVQWFDVGAARIYHELGADAIRTGVVGSDLRRADTQLGYGASIVAYTRFLGPLTIGIARNDAGANKLFLTAGYPF
jgi:outer membrane protein assembly factor BamA